MVGSNNECSFIRIPLLEWIWSWLFVFVFSFYILLKIFFTQKESCLIGLTGGSLEASIHLPVCPPTHPFSHPPTYPFIVSTTPVYSLVSPAPCKAPEMHNPNTVQSADERIISSMNPENCWKNSNDCLVSRVAKEACKVISLSTKTFLWFLFYEKC